ncbi:MAG TPA: MASE1 domain-containing protein [Candidatus Cybelea sp.]|jgi:integral membrane sensor domain MASE1
MPLLVAAAYVAAARFGFSFAFATKQVTAIWPPTGIAMAALLLFGYRVWPGIWLGAFISNVSSAEPGWTAAAIATGNTLAPAFGNFLLRRFDFQNAIERVRDVLVLVVFGCAVAMTVSATSGVLFLALARIVPWSDVPSVWWVWWTGDAMGVLLVTPLLLTWILSAKQGTFAYGRALELALLAVTLAAASWVSFLSGLPLRFSVYPFIIWTALRFRQRETATAIVVVAGIAIWATAHDLGPWGHGPFDQRLVQLDSWISVFAFTGLVLGAATAEKRAAQSALGETLEKAKDSIETLQTAFLPPSLPRRPGLRCDALYIPAEREALIGGDWYDAFELPDKRVVISIGDVTGHGLDAAVAGSRMRWSIFAAAFDAEDPAAILSKIDGAAQLPSDAPATAMVAIISADLSKLSYAGAGHPPPIVAGPHSPPHFLEYGGVPFGVGVPVAAETRTVPLEDGAAILFYTDGLTEFARNIKLAESAALRAVARLVGDSKIDHPAAFVQRSVMGSHRPSDDTVLLVARVSRNQR